jgi:hypothetical protein
MRLSKSLCAALRQYWIQLPFFLKFYICLLSSIYIKANLAGFVCLLLGDGRQLVCSGGVFFGAVLGHNGVAYSLGSVPRTRWWANVAFSLGSVLGMFGNDIYITLSVFFGVCSGTVAGQRHNNGVVFSLGSVPGVRSEGI